MHTLTCNSLKFWNLMLFLLETIQPKPDELLCFFVYHTLIPLIYFLTGKYRLPRSAIPEKGHLASAMAHQAVISYVNQVISWLSKNDAPNYVRISLKLLKIFSKGRFELLNLLQYYAWIIVPHKSGRKQHPL